MKKLLLIFFLLLPSIFVAAQTDSNAIKQAVDSIAKLLPEPAKRMVRQVARDTVKASSRVDTSHAVFAADSNSHENEKDSITSASPILIKSTSALLMKKPVDTCYLKLLDNPFFRTKQKPVYLIIDEREVSYKEKAFYLFSALFMFLAFIKVVFNKYFKNIFRLFFQPTFRQKQTREQIQQGKLPSMLLNLFFIFSVSTYATFLVTTYNVLALSFWVILLYSLAGLLAMYVGKFLFISFAGWVFGVKEASETYIFSVYLINKIMGVLLLPLTVLIAFSYPEIVTISVTCSAILIIILFIYRYVVSFTPVTREIKVSLLHFFFYICAFEVVPVLLIYKTLIIYLHNSL